MSSTRSSITAVPSTSHHLIYLSNRDNNSIDKIPSNPLTFYVNNDTEDLTTARKTCYGNLIANLRSFRVKVSTQTQTYIYISCNHFIILH